MDDKEAREAEAADAACETPQEGEAYQEDQVETLEGDVSLDEEAANYGMGLSAGEPAEVVALEKATSVDETPLEGTAEEGAEEPSAGFFGALARDIGRGLAAAGGAVGDAAAAAGGAVLAAGQAAGEAVGNVAAAAGEAVGNAAMAAGGAVGDAATAAGGVALDAAAAAGGAVVDAAVTAGGAALAAGQAAGGAIADVAANAGGAIAGAAAGAVGAVGGAVNSIDAEQVQELLDTIYSATLDGVPNVSQPVEELADDYLSKYATVEEAAKSLIGYQIVKCMTSGFIAGLGGLITLPVAIPANVSSVLYVQTRMVAALARMGGYDVSSDQVRTLVYVCLTGTAAADILKSSGVKLGEKLATSLIKKIPGETLRAINRKVGFRLVTKFGETGVVNLGKLLPLVGGVLGGGMDAITTQTIASNAYRLFIEGRMPTGGVAEEVEEAVGEVEAEQVVVEEVIEDAEGEGTEADATE